MSVCENVNRREFLTTAALAAAVGSASGQTAGQSAGLRAGAAAANITLPLGATNGGVIARGGSADDVHDELHARCLVLDDGQTRIAFAVCDARMIARSVIEKAKQIVEKETGLTPDRILISATHTHAAPGLIGLDRVPLDGWYLDFVAGRISDGIRRAAARLAPATVGWGTGSLPQHVFNRRWIMKPGSVPKNPFGDTGERVQMNPKGGSPDLVEPAGPVDPQLFVLSVKHSDGRPLALLANYGLHYVGGYKGSAVSADYYGVFADRVQQLLGADRQDPPFVGIMSNGTSGDVNNVDFRRPRPAAAPWVRMREVAFDVAEEAVRVWKGIQHVSQVRLGAQATDLQLGVRRPDAARLEWARVLLAREGRGPRMSRPQIYADEALHLSKFPESAPVRLQALRIGELGIAAVPCEVFAETGLAVKKSSPLRSTFVIELANGYNGYLPTRRQHELGGYETWPARSAYLEVGAEEKIRAQLLALLGKI